MFRRIVMLVLLLILLTNSWSIVAQSVELDLDRIQRATVLIMQVDESDLSITCVGSGTIVSYDGLILTNAHHTLPNPQCSGTRIIIATTIDSTQPPVPRYQADVVQADSGLDLALLRITRELDGSAIEPSQLPILPFVELADSSNVNIDDTITIIGYPTLDEDPMTVTRAVVTAFFAEPSGGERSWFKVNSLNPIGGVATGGGAYNATGQLIGIPTTVPTQEIGAGTTCRYLDDTNADGFINNNDRCIPIGDFLTTLRPSRFAQPLIRSASLRLDVEKLTAPDFQQTGQSRGDFSRLFFAPSIIDGLPSTVIGRLPAGADSLFLFFDYTNMTPETIYEVRTTLDGLPFSSFSLPPVRWSGGRDGVWYVGLRGQTIPNGIYEFRLFIDGGLVAEQSITVSGAPESLPSFSNVVFGLLDEEGNLAGNGYVLPVGAIATARFVYQNMVEGIPWTAIWYYNNNVIVRTDDVWNADDGANGAYPISLQPIDGLLPGNYRLDLYINGRLSATGDFAIAGAQETALPRVFNELEFYRTSSPLVLPDSTPANSFPDGANTLYAVFDWQQIATGTLWTLEWSVDGEVFYRSTLPWSSLESGNDFTVRLTAPEGLPDGAYEIGLYVNGVLLDTEEASIGIGQLPIDQFATASGVTLRGRIIDAESQQGIDGAVFYLISEDFAVADFVYDDEQLYAVAIADRNGNFEIDRSLQLETPYSVVVEAQGYLPVTGDGYSLSVEDGNPVEILIMLARD
jgi:hypothetical protein